MGNPPFPVGLAREWPWLPAPAMFLVTRGQAPKNWRLAIATSDSDTRFSTYEIRSFMIICFLCQAEPTVAGRPGHDMHHVGSIPRTGWFWWCRLVQGTGLPRHGNRLLGGWQEPASPAPKKVSPFATIEAGASPLTCWGPTVDATGDSRHVKLGNFSNSKQEESLVFPVRT